MHISNIFKFCEAFTDDLLESDSKRERESIKKTCCTKTSSHNWKWFAFYISLLTFIGIKFLQRSCYQSNGYCQQSHYSGQYNCFSKYFHDSHCLKSFQIRIYFWSVFSCIQTEYRKIRTRKNSVFGHFSHSVLTIN